MSMSLDVIDKVREIEQQITKKETVLGKGLLQPFSNTNSASRKLMFSSQLEQVLPLMEGEVPDITTGYEAEFGKYSSSMINADQDYEVVAIIPKFLDKPIHNYTIVFKGKNTNNYTIVERVGYTHITESYGYLLNNEELDKLNPGSTVSKGTTVQKSVAFDKYNNRQDGINLTVAYMSPNKTTEDGIIVSESVSRRLASPLIDKVRIVINDNDIPLNLYGDSNNYKSFPNINEDIKDGILCGIRRDRKEESLFTQSFNRLSKIMISDEKYTISGKVVDINIYCNNPEALTASYYNKQLKDCYDVSMDYHRRIVETLKPIIDNSLATCSYEMKKLYDKSKRTLLGHKHMNDKVFSNTIIEITVLRRSELSVGDKLTDRFGGKGVVSEIRPDHLMPILDNDEPVDIIFNIFGCVNRENPGQLFEVSTTYIARRIVDHIRDSAYVPAGDMDDLLALYIDFIEEFSMPMADWVREKMTEASEEEKAMLLDSLVEDKVLKLTLEPIAESLSIEKLDRIYRKFDWIWQNPYKVKVPILGSNGEYRFVEARRSLYAGRKYVYRLKQYAKDKFSATSLSATNIRNEPTKSKANKNYKFPYTKTPIRFGEMETGDMEHLDVITVATNLMLHSNSPIGRKQTKNLYTDDPFDVNIELNSDAKNRNVEILNVYLKTAGLKIVFKAVPKRLVTPFEILPFEITDDKHKWISPIEIEGKDLEPKVDAFSFEDKDGNVLPFYIAPFTII